MSAEVFDKQSVYCNAVSNNEKVLQKVLQEEAQLSLSNRATHLCCIQGRG